MALPPWAPGAILALERMTAMSILHPLTWTLLLGAGAAVAQALAGDLQTCRKLGDAAARLACYDQIALDEPRAAAQAARARPAAPAAAAAALPAAATATADFGLPRAQGAPEQLVSRFEGRFEGWGPNSRIRLANGQVWQITDGSSAVYYLPSPKITVRRAMMGGFVMDVDGVNQLPRVRRVE